MKKRIYLLSALAAMVWVGLLNAESPDYGNDPVSAEPIDSDGSVLYGELTTGDVDWFVFTPAGDSRYQITFHNQDANYKYIKVYQEDQFGDLIEVQGWYINNSGAYRTLFLESDRDCYIYVYSATGGYSVSVNYLGTTAPDTYGNTCAVGASLTVDAPAMIGTLDHSDPYDVDWFNFNTQALHMYRVTLTHTDNSWVRFQLYAEDCAGLLYGETYNMTVISWYGEDYNLYVYGDAGRMGNYYTIHVEDLGQYSDDYGNTSDAATIVPTGGTQTFGNIDYMGNVHSDLDWFKFTPAGHARYEIKFFNQNANYKYMRIYQENEFGDLIQTDYSYVNNGGLSRMLFIENTRPCYVQIDSAAGGYWFSVEQIDIVPPDTYSKTCDQAVSIIPDDEPTVGTLDHTNPYDTDWFEFETQALHKYQIVLTHTVNSWVRFCLHDESCGNQLYGETYDITVMSWFGENYNLNVYGDAGRLGNYYTMQVIDLGLQPDDYPNVFNLATPIAKDGTYINGVIDYLATVGRDQDWFTFVAAIDGNYEIKLYNSENNYKYLYLYRKNEFNEPVQINSGYVNANVLTKTLNLTAGTYYLRVDDGLGDYQISVLSPDPRCGDLDHPYPAGDANNDCYVDLKDLATMGQSWLTCSDPNPPCNHLP